VPGTAPKPSGARVGGIMQKMDSGDTIVTYVLSRNQDVHFFGHNGATAT